MFVRVFQYWLRYTEQNLFLHRYKLYTGIGKRYFVEYFGDHKHEYIKEKQTDDIDAKQKTVKGVHNRQK